MAFINYKPYEGADFGTGDFTHESGKVLPLHDPFEAQRLLAQQQAQNAPIADQPDASAPPPVQSVQPEAPAPAAPSPSPAPAPQAPAKPAPLTLPEGATRLKDDEADNDLRKRSMGIVNAVKDYPMGSVVPMGDGIYGRVEQHTWTNKDGKRVPGHFRGVTLYKDAASKPTAELEGGVSYPGDTETKADVSTSTDTAAVAAKKKSEYKSPWNAEETQAMQNLIKEYPKLTEEGVTNIFKHETGADLSPTRRNSLGYGGLFQLQPSQEKKLIEGGDITKLSRAQQIEQYGNYLQSHNVPRDATDSDLALAQAAPGAIGKPDDTVVYKAGSEKAKANPAWLDKSGNATVGSIKAYYEASGPGTTTVAANGPDPSSIGPNTAVQQGGTATQGVSSSESESIHKGIPYTPEDQAKHGAIGTDFATSMNAAHQPVLDAQEIQNSQLHLQAIEQKDLLNKKLGEEEEYKQKYAESVNEIKSRQKLVDDDKEPPPFGGNVLAGILAAVAQAAGAYASVLTHTPNQAMEVINQGLARDNARWKQAHMDKVYGVKNAQDLSQAQRIQLDHAATQRQMQQSLALDTEYKAQLGQTQTAQGKAAVQALIAQNNQKLAEEDLTLQRQSRDVVQTSKQAGSTSSTGTSWQTKDKPDAKAADITKFMDGPREGVAGRAELDELQHSLTHILAPALGFDYKEGKNGQVGSFSLPKDFTDRLARNPLTGSAWGKVGQAISHPIDSLMEATGTAEQAKGDKPGESVHDSVEARKNAYTALQTVMNERLYKLSGKAVTPQEFERQKDAFVGLSPENQVEQLNSLMQNLQNKVDNLKSKYPGAEEVWQSRRANDPQHANAPQPQEVVQ